MGKKLTENQVKNRLYAWVGERPLREVAAEAGVATTTIWDALRGRDNRGRKVKPGKRLLAAIGVARTDGAPEYRSIK